MKKSWQFVQYLPVQQTKKLNAWRLFFFRIRYNLKSNHGVLGNLNQIKVCWVCTTHMQYVESSKVDGITFVTMTDKIQESLRPLVVCGRNAGPRCITMDNRGAGRERGTTAAWRIHQQRNGREVRWGEAAAAFAAVDHVREKKKIC